MADDNFHAWLNRGRRIARRPGFAALVFLTAALWSVWPMPRLLTTHLPQGGVAFGTVVKFNLWTMWWNSEWFLTESQDYWRAPIFHPHDNALAFSEPQPLTLLAAPVIWLTGSRVLAYNLYLLATLTLNGVFANKLLREVRVPSLMACLTAVVVVLLPVVQWQIDVLQVTVLWPVLWLWMSWLRLLKQPRIRHGISAGLAFTVLALACVHHALFVAVLMVPVVLATCRPLWNRRGVIAVLAGGLTTTVLLAPLIIPLRTALNQNRFQRTDDSVERMSAMLADYTGTPGSNLLSDAAGWSRPHWRLSAGWTRYLFAFSGIAAIWWQRRWRRPALFLLVVATAALCLSLGPHLRLGSWQPWVSLAELIPGLKQARNVFRFAYFFQLAIVLLVGIGFACLQRWLRCLSRWQTNWSTDAERSSWHRRGLCPVLLLRITVLVCGAVTISEVTPTPVALARVPDATDHEQWLQFVREHLPTDAALVCLPASSGYQPTDFEPTADWMYLATFHGRPLLDGYSGFFPADYFPLSDLLRKPAWTTGDVWNLYDRGARMIVVDTRRVSAELHPAGTYGPFRISRAFDDSRSGIVIFTLDLNWSGGDQ